ncbi:helix-turn-helix transcriptional regulator [Amycolatopsis pigmentata]|uniref:LuxR C-terminal-related transcriptional regulator n=1 Tax=Amycolatopsis pigmentata TaxID=450801 RepID=A0ABW5FQB7_9PSEU
MRHKPGSTRVTPAKTAVPRMPASFVRREPLRALLGKAVEAPVTLVAAPAGYGKTVLLADWVETAGGEEKAWVSLDGADNEPRRFWGGTLEALRECVPTDSPLAKLEPPEAGDQAGFLAEIVDALDFLPHPVCLVLDDLHEVTARETMHGLETLIRHQPAMLRLVLSSRADPPLPLARLRMEGRLGMLRAHDLRFSEEDAERLLRATGVTLTGDQLHLLVERTGGWAAGLRLAARPLREAGDRDAFLADFAGDDHAVADYLVGEVLARWPEDTVDFLQVISVCDEADPLLAEVLSGREDAGAVLDALERESALVMAVGRDGVVAYRTHPLLRTYLRGDLHRRRPELAADLHRVAAAWFASGAQPHKALDHAAEADERGTVVDLLHRHAVPLLLNGDHLLVRRALSIIGAPAAAEDPWLALISAVAHLEAGELTAAHASLTDAGAGSRGELMSLRRLVATTYALARGEAPEIEATQWREVFGDGPGLEAWARLGAGWAFIRTGERDHARRELDAVDRLAREQGLGYLVMHGLTARAVASGMDGDYGTMERACAESVAIADRHDWRRCPWLAMSRLMLGFARLMRLDPAGALEDAARAAETAGDAPDPALRYLVRVLRGAAWFDAGRHSDALQLLRGARWDLADTALLPELAVTAALAEYRCALRLGHHTAAREVFLWAKRRAPRAPELPLMIAWDRFARGDIDAADRAADTVVDTASSPVRLEGWLVKCAVAIRSGRRTFARTALGNAVRLAEPDVLIRPFRQADEQVRQLLAEQIGGFGGADAFAARIRRALSDMDGRGPGDGPLTEREHVVLSRLTSQASLDEVAVDLAVSVNTIKTHVRAIYAKLGVNNRRAAAAAAREHGLT